MLETNGYQQFVTFDIDGYEQVTKEIVKQTVMNVRARSSVLLLEFVYHVAIHPDHRSYFTGIFLLSSLLGVHLIPLGILAIKMAFPAPQVWRSLPPTLDDLVNVKTIRVCYSLLFTLLVLSLNK